MVSSHVLPCFTNQPTQPVVWGRFFFPPQQSAVAFSEANKGPSDAMSVTASGWADPGSAWDGGMGGGEWSTGIYGNNQQIWGYNAGYHGG